MTAIKSLYSNVSSCVRINNYYTDWFDVSAGLRQGCCLSPILFNLYVDDFVKTVKAFDTGVDIGNGENAGILLYADDVVLLAEREDDLQFVLNILDRWCTGNKIVVVCKKAKLFTLGRVRYLVLLFCSNVAPKILI